MAKLDRKAIALWQARFTKAEALQKNQSKERKQAIQLYTGTFYGEPTDNQTDHGEVNFVYEFLDVLISALFARNPKFFARTDSISLQPFAETVERVLNKVWRNKKYFYGFSQILYPFNLHSI